MTVYEQLIDKGFAEKLTEYDLVNAAYNLNKRVGLHLELQKLERDLEEIISEVTFD